MRALSPPSSPLPPDSTSPSPNLAQEGPKTIDELVAAAMQQLTLSGFRVADGSDIRADPTNGEILSLLTAPKFDITEPSPFVKTPHPSSAPLPGSSVSSSRRPRKAAEDTAAVAAAVAAASSGMAPPPFAGRDGWADQLNALARDFVPTRFPSGPAPAAPAATTAPSPASNELGVGPTPTPTTGPGAGTDGSRELDPTLVSALVVGDLDWFTSLVGMFDGGETGGMDWDMNAPPQAQGSMSAASTSTSAAAAFGAPQAASTASLFPTAVGEDGGWSLGQQELASSVGSNPIPMGVQSQVDPGDPRQWQGQGLPMPQSAL